MSGFIVGIVSEGPTDYEVITNVFSYVIPGKHKFRSVQPDYSETDGLGVKKHSNGWKGVLSWCEAEGKHGIISYLDALNIDVLIVQIDADISREPEIQCARPCPQAEDTIIEIENLVRAKLNIACFDSRIICCIPSDNMESWLLTAYDADLIYHGEDKFIECLHDPDEILSKPPFKLLRRKDGKVKKNQVLYRELIPDLIVKWDYVKLYCTQAQKLHQNLLNIPRTHN